MENQNIEKYLLENNLKPLFIFATATCTNYFGVFVGSKGAKKDGDADFDTTQIYWNGTNQRPIWTISTPLWILPLNKELLTGDYSLAYNVELSIAAPGSCDLTVIDHFYKEETPETPRIIKEWKDYKDLDTVNKDEGSLKNYSLKFQTDSLLFSKEAHFTMSSPDERTKLHGWLFGSATITTTDVLIGFAGVPCEIVDKDGKKNDFHIWCGIRKTTPGKIFLSINNLDGKDEEIGNDCPLVWRKTGLFDDTIFPKKGNPAFRIENENLALSANPDYQEYAYKISNVVHTPIKANRHHCWLIKEQRNIYPFFRFISKSNLGQERDQLGSFLNFNAFNEINSFQVNRVGNGFSKDIIVWATAIFKDTTKDLFKSINSASHLVRKANPYTLTPIFEAIDFTGRLQQLVLEYAITGDDVSLVGLKGFNPNTGELNDMDFTARKVALHNFRLSSFKRATYLPADPSGSLDLKTVFRLKEISFSTANLGSRSDNGTLFSFNISSTKSAPEESKEELFFNDGSMSFQVDRDGTIEGKVSFSLQLQKAQKPLYLWQWYPALEKRDTIIPCFSIEDFKLPVVNVSPLANDATFQDKYSSGDDQISLNATGTIKPEQPLIIPLNEKESAQKYYLSLSESINVGQDYNSEMALLKNEVTSNAIGEDPFISLISLGNQPQNLIKIRTPFGTNSVDDNGKFIVARKNNLSIDGGTWEMLADDNLGTILTFPPQDIGEAFRKTDLTPSDLPDALIDGEPIDDQLVKFKFGPPSVLRIENEQLNRQFVSVPWNLKNLFANYGDSNPGLRLLQARFELLYGMSGYLENPDAYIAELEHKLGQLVKAPRDRIVWNANKEQKEEFNAAFSAYIKMMRLWVSRLAVYEVSNRADKFSPAKFSEGIDYFFRIENDEGKIKGASLKWPFKAEPNTYLQEIKEKYHQKDGLSGGFHFGFESMAVYKELFEGGLRNGSSSGTIENLAFTLRGGYGKQLARYNNDKTIIKSTTALGRTHFYAIERIGRIGVLWNKAKHVIEYERTVVPSKQFQGTRNVGRVVVRKVREFVEVLEFERNYPEFGVSQSSSGSILGSHFKSVKIPVSSSWGRDILDQDQPIGWEVPLWNKAADQEIYPFPQIMFKVLASKEANLPHVLNTIANPQNLYFYTDVRESVNDRLITAETNDWPSVPTIDFTLQEFSNIYLQAKPCLNYDDPKLVGIPLPSPNDTLPGFERFTFEILPSEIPVSANGAYQKDSKIVGKIKTVTMQRQPSLEGKVDPQTAEFVKLTNDFLLNNLNGYQKILGDQAEAGKIDADKCLAEVRNEIAAHIGAIATNGNFTALEELTITGLKAPKLSYFDRVITPQIKDFHRTVGVGGTESWEPTTLLLWYQLANGFNAGISAVDYHYKTMFNVLQGEIFELIDQIDPVNEGMLLKEKIADFGNQIADVADLIDFNINHITQAVNLAKGKMDAALLSFKETNDARLNVFFIEMAGHVDQIPDTTDIAAFKTAIDTRVNQAVDKEIQDILAKCAYNTEINLLISCQLTGYVTACKALTNDILNRISAPFAIDEAKAAVVAAIDGFKSSAKQMLEDTEHKLQEQLSQFNQSMSDQLNSFVALLQATLVIQRTKLMGNVTAAQQAIDKIIIEQDRDKQRFKKALTDTFFGFREDLVQALAQNVLSLLIEGYVIGAAAPIPPLAHLLNSIDRWTKGLVKDFSSLLKKFFDGRGTADIKKVVGDYLDQALALYPDFKALETAIRNGGKEEIVKYANRLSQAINTDFGKEIGRASSALHEFGVLGQSIADFNKELKNTLFNYRSVMEDIKAVDLGFNRKTIELIYNFNEKNAPRLLLTPVMGKLQKVNDALSSMGFELPYLGLEEQFLSPLKEWGDSFKKSLSKEFPLSNLLKDIGGFKFDHLFPFLKGDDAFFKSVKISHGIDEVAMKAWVKANVDYTFTADNTLMNVGPVQVTLLKNARILAEANESIDIDSKRISKNIGTLKATFEISLSGTPLMRFKDTVVSFKDGDYSFDLDPSRMEMPGFLKIITDASTKIKPAPSAGKESPFRIAILKWEREVLGRKLEIPIGVTANLDLPPINVGGGTTSITNLTIGGNFRLQAMDPQEVTPRLDFLIGLGFYLGKRDLPFNLTAFILGGGGYIDCNFTYKPSTSKSPSVNFIMSVHASAGLAVSAGWITGSIMIFAGIEIEYNSNIRTTRIEIFIAISGNVDIIGLITIFIGLRLSINYLSNGNETVLYGVGRVSVKIKICSFVTIRVSKNYTMVLKGESKTVSNGHSEEVAASLN